MRHISLDQLERIAKRVDIDSLAEAGKSLAGIREPEARKEFIKKNSAKWTALKHALWMLGCCKCWYSEAELKADFGEVEHYRPKNDVWKSNHDGYWWLAFCISNLRFADQMVNTRRQDYCTEIDAGKGCYFPIDGGDVNRAFSEKDMAKEKGKNVLLDPTVAADCRLLRFLENGRPEPEYEKDEDAWKHTRAKESIEYYHLDDGTWNRDRRNLMTEVRRLCEELLDRKCDPAKEDELIEQVMEKIHPFSEFSAAAFQVVCSMGFFERIKGVGV